jgi:hypothetical protein
MIAAYRDRHGITSGAPLGNDLVSTEAPLRRRGWELSGVDHDAALQPGDGAELEAEFAANLGVPTTTFGEWVETALRGRPSSSNGR